MISHTASPACNLLFYPGCAKETHTIRHVFQVLSVESPALARYALLYLSIIRDILKLESQEMDSVSMTLVHYDPLGAINPHVDTVYMFDGKLGPIFTVATGASDKLLDLLPVLAPVEQQPVRIFSKRAHANGRHISHIVGPLQAVGLSS